MKTKTVFHSFGKIDLKLCNAIKKLNEIQAHNPKNFNKTGKIAIASAIIGILIITVIAGIYLQRTLPIHESSLAPDVTSPPYIPFDYNIGVYPNNGTIQQGNSIQTNINITCLQGSAQAVTLNAVAEPNSILCSFFKQSGTPSSNNTFTSILVINALAATPAGIYQIDIKSTAANGKTYSSAYTLTVLTPQIQVSGTVEDISSNDTWITQIQFVASSPTGTASTFTVGIHYSYALQKQGTYSISLPNQQRYIVTIYWETFTGYGEGVYGSILVNCTMGVSSMTQGFSL